MKHYFYPGRPEKKFAPSPGSTERGKYYRYLFFTGNTLEPLLSVTQLGVEDIQPHMMGWGDMPRVMATIESMTPETGWAVGEHFTAADVVFGGYLDYSIRIKWIEASPKVLAYMERIRARPVYQATRAWPAELS